jgi:hypothetical protein
MQDFIHLLSPPRSAYYHDPYFTCSHTRVSESLGLDYTVSGQTGSNFILQFYSQCDSIRPLTFPDSLVLSLEYSEILGLKDEITGSGKR